jgi:hypothetical protein
MSASLDTKVSNTPFAHMKAMLRTVSAPKQVARESLSTHENRKTFSNQVKAESQSGQKTSSPDSKETDSSFDSKSQSQGLENNVQVPLLVDIKNFQEPVIEGGVDPIDVVEATEAGASLLVNYEATKSDLKTEASLADLGSSINPLDALGSANQGKIDSINKASEADIPLSHETQMLKNPEGEKVFGQGFEDAQLPQDARSEEALISQSRQLPKQNNDIQNSAKTIADKQQDAIIVEAAKSGQIRSTKQDSDGMRVAAETHELMDRLQDLLGKNSSQIVVQNPAEQEGDRPLEQEFEPRESVPVNKPDQDLAPENIIAMKFALPVNQKVEAKPVLQAMVYQSKQMNPILQVADGIQHVMQQGQPNRVHVQLFPETLGAVDIIVDMAETGKLSILVQAEKSSTYDLLRLDSANMHQALVNSGLDMGLQDLEFSHMNSSDQNQSNGYKGANHRQSHSADAFETQGPVLDEPLIYVDPNFVRIRA